MVQIIALIAMYVHIIIHFNILISKKTTRNFILIKSFKKYGINDQRKQFET